MPVRRRGSRWQADFMHEGVRYRQAFAHEADAKVWEATTKAALIAGRELPQASPSVTAPQSLGAFVRFVERTHWAHKRSGGSLARYAFIYMRYVGEHLSVKETLTTERIEDFLRHREIDHRNSGSTVNRYAASISKLVTIAIKQGLLPLRPDIRKRPEGDSRERIFSEAEEAQLLAVVEMWGYTDHRDLFIFLADTGCRLGEAEKLPWSAFMAGGIIDIPRTITKSGKGRVIALTPRAQAAIDRLRKLYGHQTGPFAWHDRRTTRTLWDRLRGHFSWMDSSCVLHTFRHTCASRLVQEQGDLYPVQRWLGHSSPLMTQRYAKYCPQNMKELAALLDRRLHRRAA